MKKEKKHQFLLFRVRFDIITRTIIEHHMFIMCVHACIRACMHAHTNTGGAPSRQIKMSAANQLSAFSSIKDETLHTVLC